MGRGRRPLRDAPLNDARVSDDGLVADAGVITIASDNGELDEFAAAFADAIARHRHFERQVSVVPA
jgi:hypothetical protein